MAGFEGWWVNGRTGKGHHVAEHWMEVKGDPTKYGLTDKEVDQIVQDAGGSFNPGDTSPDGARGMLLKAAMKNGWVRVRGYRSRYSIQTYGHLASHLPKVLSFLKKAGVGLYSEFLLSDLASTYHQQFVGFSDIVRDLKQGKIPDLAPKDPAKNIKSLRTGISTDLSDKQQRVLLRQQLGQKTHIPDPSPDDDMLPESHALRKGLKRLLG